MLWAGAMPARAQDAQRVTSVVIVRADGDDALVQRVREELDTGAFTITELDGHANAPLAELVALAQANAADAALRVRQKPYEVELWTARPADDPDGTIDVIREPGASRHEQEVLVLRVVETLRALGLGPVASPVEPPPTKPPAKPPAKPSAKPTATPASAPKAPEEPTWSARSAVCGLQFVPNRNSAGETERKNSTDS